MIAALAVARHHVRAPVRQGGGIVVVPAHAGDAVHTVAVEDVVRAILGPLAHHVVALLVHRDREQIRRRPEVEVLRVRRARLPVPGRGAVEAQGHDRLPVGQHGVRALLAGGATEDATMRNSAPHCQFAYLYPSREAHDGSSSLGLDEQSLAAPPARSRAMPTPDGNASLRLSRLACRKGYDRLRPSGSGAGRWSPLGCEREPAFGSRYTPPFARASTTLPPFPNEKYLRSRTTK